jgi:hypothetical protein
VEAAVSAAVDELRELLGSGSITDPDVVDACLSD